MDIKKMLQNLMKNRPGLFNCYVTGQEDSKPYLLCGAICVSLCELEEAAFQVAFRDSQLHANLVAIDAEVSGFPQINEPTLENQVKLQNLKTRRQSMAAQLSAEIAEYFNERKKQFEATSSNVSEQEAAAKI